MTTKENSIINSNLLEEFTLDYLKEHEELINFVKKETEKQLRIGGVSGSFYNHKPTGIKGTFIKKYKPTGKPETIMIGTLDNDVYCAPAIEFEQINYN